MPSSRVSAGRCWHAGTIRCCAEIGDRIRFVPANKTSKPCLVFGDSCVSSSRIFLLGWALPLACWLAPSNFSAGAFSLNGLCCGPLVVGVASSWVIVQNWPHHWTCYSSNITLRQLGLTLLWLSLVCRGHSFMEVCRARWTQHLFGWRLLSMLTGICGSILVGYKLFKILFRAAVGFMNNQPAILWNLLRYDKMGTE